MIAFGDTMPQALCVILSQKVIDNGYLVILLLQFLLEVRVVVLGEGGLEGEVKIS